MRIVVISRADGGVSIMPLDNSYDALFEAALDEHIIEPEIRQWEAVASPEWLPIKGWRILAKGEQVPLDRTFRNALCDDGTKLDHDMPKARGIWRDKLRAVRQPLLAALDVAYQRADEINDATAKKQVVASKQALRDVTADPAIEKAQTPEELKAVWPDALKE